MQQSGFTLCYCTGLTDSMSVYNIISPRTSLHGKFKIIGNALINYCSWGLYPWLVLAGLWPSRNRESIHRKQQPPPHLKNKTNPLWKCILQTRASLHRHRNITHTVPHRVVPSRGRACLWAAPSLRNTAAAWPGPGPNRELHTCHKAQTDTGRAAPTHSPAWARGGKKQTTEWSNGQGHIADLLLHRINTCNSCITMCH